MALADPPGLYFSLNDRVVGHLGTKVMEAFLLTSVFASTLAIQNAATRYVFNLGRQGYFPSILGRVHLRHASPHCASVATSLLTVLPAVGFGLAGTAPIVQLAAISTALGTIGILTLQALAAGAVTLYFARCREVHWWKTVTAPLLAAFTLVLIVYFGIQDFGILTGNGSLGARLLPWSMLIAFLVGFSYARWSERHRPALYAELAQP
jgi:amino acid transporter